MVLAGTANAVTSTFSYNSAFQQIASATDPLSRTVNFNYDSIGNLTSVTDPLGHQSSFTYNAAGQALTATNPIARSASAHWSDVTLTRYVSSHPRMLELRSHSERLTTKELPVTKSSSIFSWTDEQSRATFSRKGR